jgi:hypothetical protein
VLHSSSVHKQVSDEGARDGDEDDAGPVDRSEVASDGKLNGQEDDQDASKHC